MHLLPLCEHFRPHLGAFTTLGVPDIYKRFKFPFLNSKRYTGRSVLATKMCLKGLKARLGIIYGEKIGETGHSDLKMVQNCKNS